MSASDVTTEAEEPLPGAKTPSNASGKIEEKSEDSVATVPPSSESEEGKRTELVEQRRGRKNKVFPCVDERPLLTRPFCGLLVPPALFSKHLGVSLAGEHSAQSKQQKAAKSKKAKRRAAQQPRKGMWGCWLCEAHNEDGKDRCASCNRVKEPAWLRLVTGERLAVGDVVRLHFLGKSASKSKVDGLLTRIDYQARLVEVHGREEGSNAPPGAHLVQLGVDADASLVWTPQMEEADADEEAALALCQFLVCGDCAGVSRLSNGRCALDSEVVREDKRARLRGVDKTIGELEVRTKYLLRKWKETKTNAMFDDMTTANADLAAAKTDAESIRNQLAPQQLWCTACGWQWPAERPFCVEQP